MAKHHSLVLLLLSMLVSMAAGTQFKVGGSQGWRVPDDPNAMSYSQWAQKTRFQVGDSLLFFYLPDEDSVLLVNADGYSNCNTSSYIDSFNDGNTVFTFTHSGPFYFISGSKDNCEKGEKLTVVVMANRSNKTSPAAAPSLSPPADVSPPPPPSVEVVGEPTASPPPNGVSSSKVVGLTGIIGTIFGVFVYVF